jgi:hypothetical protein
MAVKFTYINAFLCENVLQESTGIFSAIRIVDVFQIPENVPDNFAIRFFVVGVFRMSNAPRVSVTVKVFIIRVNGERLPLPDIPGQPFPLSSFEDDASIPSGINVLLEVNVKPTNMGTAFVEIEIDDEVAAKIPFTIRRIPTLQASVQ